MHLLKGQWILLIIKFNHQSVQITKVINMINDHWKVNDLLININSYWLSQHKFRVEADLTRLVIWHFLVTLDLPQKISAGFCRKCILSEMRWNLARIIKFPSCRSPWINGREEERVRKADVKSFCMHIWKNTKVWSTGFNIPHQRNRLLICLHPL